MKRITKKDIIINFIIALFSCQFGNVAFAQNIGINSTGANPHPSALLDIDASPSNDKGLLIPRIPLTALNVAAPIITPTVSLLVYNTAAASTGTNAVSPGYYYWDGTQWVRFAYNPSGINTVAWNILGNIGTNSITHFLGTTDTQDLVFKTNAIEWMRILSNGRVGVGTNAPTTSFEVVGTATNTAVFIRDANSSLSKIGIGAGTGFAYLDFYNSSGVLKSNVAFDNTNSYLLINAITNTINTIMNPLGGNVGVHTTNPLARFQVMDNLNQRTLHVEHDFSGLVNTDAAFVGGVDAGFTNTGLFVLQKDNVGFGSPNTNLINVVKNSVSQMLINGVGNMGVGTTTPSSKITAAGNIEAWNANGLQNAMLTVDGGLELYRHSTSANAPEISGYIDFKKDITHDVDFRINYDNTLGTNGGLAFITTLTGTLPALNRMVILNQNGNVGINTLAPSEKLEVQGSVKIVDGTQGAGKVLTSDASGKGSWQSTNLLNNVIFTIPAAVNSTVTQIGTFTDSYLGVVSYSVTQVVYNSKFPGTSTAWGVLGANSSLRLSLSFAALPYTPIGFITSGTPSSCTTCPDNFAISLLSSTNSSLNFIVTRIDSQDAWTVPFFIKGLIVK